MKPHPARRGACLAALSFCVLTLGGQTRSTTGTIKVPFPFSDPSNQGGWTPYAPLSDEFTGPGLDTTRWRTNIAGWPGRPPALFADHNVAVAHGLLRVTLQKEAVDHYTTGAVQSVAPVLYGYFEVRARAMRSAGSSGFWFANRDEKDWNEIDVAEMGGSRPADPKRVFMSAHVFRADGLEVKQNDIGSATLKTNVADGFHIYGLHWTPEWLDFYIDGRLRRRLANTSWHTPATLILDAETQVDWWGMPRDADLPSVFSIDYVRAWKQATVP